MAAFSAASLPFTASDSEAFTIQFDYSYDTGFFASGSDARARLQDAGAFFESIIGDDFDAIVPGGSNSWNTTFTDPSNGGPGFQSNPTIPADTIIVYVGARDLGSGGGGGDILGSASLGGWSGGGTAEFLDTIRQRGETGSTQSPGATDFAPWGGSLTMDSDSNWDYSGDGSSLDPGEWHFYSVLLHEMGHILGVGTADSWNAQVNGSNEFIGAASVAEYGGNVPLQTGGGHWIDDLSPPVPSLPIDPIQSPIWGTSTLQEVAMDPSIGSNQTKFFTELDVAGLQDIGWEILSPVPEPGAALLASWALVGLFLRRRR